MKTSVILFLMLLLTAANVLGGNISGKYVRETDNELSEIEIKLLPGGKVHVTGISFWGTKHEYGPHDGELDFISSIKNGRVKYSEKVGKRGYYKLELTFKEKSLSAKEEGISGNFGMNVSFAGEHRKNESYLINGTERTYETHFPLKLAFVRCDNRYFRRRF